MRRIGAAIEENDRCSTSGLHHWLKPWIGQRGMQLKPCAAVRSTLPGYTASTRQCGLLGTLGIRQGWANWGG
jgi:hypothetical protein